ncbi:MAG: hypothetical protein RJS98_01745 [Rhodospirillaceae bacterium]
MKTRATAAISAFIGVVYVLTTSASAAPGYDQDRNELEWVIEQLKEWLPGTWDSYPQVWYEKNIRAPSNAEDGLHDHWYRTFALIDAPQVGDVVFYGQINAGGPNGPIVGRSQVLFNAVIDEELGAVNIFGQGPAEPEKYENLHERPELWRKVRQREPEAINCDWLWRRDGNQVFGVLQGKSPDTQLNEPGTCSFTSKRTGEQFKADTEWVLTPEQLWLYDNNWSAGFLFLGREDQTHIRLHRARPYQCQLSDRAGTRKIGAYDRGFHTTATGDDGREYDLMLLRAEFPKNQGSGLDDLLRLSLSDGNKEPPVAFSIEPPVAETITLNVKGISVSCELGGSLPRLHKKE